MRNASTYWHAHLVQPSWRENAFGVLGGPRLVQGVREVSLADHQPCAEATCVKSNRSKLGIVAALGSHADCKQSDAIGHLI